MIFSFLGILILVLPIPARDRTSVEHTFKVEASRFAYTPSIIRVNPGDQITIESTSQDVVHGLAVDGYDLEIQSDPGQTARLTFTANRPGTYRLRCSVTCGSMHPFMIGKLQVGNNPLLWRGAGLGLLLVVAGVWRGFR